MTNPQLAALANDAACRTPGLRSAAMSDDHRDFWCGTGALEEMGFFDDVPVCTPPRSRLLDDGSESPPADLRGVSPRLTRRNTRPGW
jgi:hypothetical protein